MTILDVALTEIPQEAALVAISPEVATGLWILMIVSLILLSGFFASAEIAIFSLENHRLNTLVDEKARGAATLSALKSNPRRLLVTILVGNNLANIGMSSLTTGVLALYFTPSESVLIATVGITSLVLLFGETAPKSYAVEHSESWALKIARPLRYIQVLLYPLVGIFDVLTRIVTRIMGSEGDFEYAYITRAEVGEVIAAGRRAGVFTEEEHTLLQRILRFRNRIVKETMVPRRDIVAVEADTDIETAIEKCLVHGVIQLPVYENVLDTVIGTVHILDLVSIDTQDTEVSLRDIAKEPYIVPETKEVDELLAELREERRRMGIVVDEFGSIAGIVTIENIIEEIIGEILTETEVPPIQWLDDTTVIVRGELNLHAANEALGIDLPDTGEFESIAGLLLDKTGRIVEEGESVVIGDVRFIVETAENNRILEVRVELPSGSPAASGNE